LYRCFLLLTAAVLAPCVAGAQQRCSSEGDQATFETQALKTELMVVAMSCQDQAKYNAFMNRFQSAMAQNERELDAYFKRAYGGRAQREHDQYVTNLANAQSRVALNQGTDFCPRNDALFSEVMALQNPGQLSQYAAGKDLIPPSLGACEVPASAPAKVSHARATTRATRKKQGH
jgi:hypothetical protein